MRYVHLVQVNAKFFGDFSYRKPTCGASPTSGD